MQNGHPITFESKKFCGAQLQWPTHEKELYTIVCCLKMWQHYLGMYNTKIFTKKHVFEIFRNPTKGFNEVTEMA
jgi:hypothetical protein